MIIVGSLDSQISMPVPKYARTCQGTQSQVRLEFLHRDTGRQLFGWIYHEAEQNLLVVKVMSD